MKTRLFLLACLVMGIIYSCRKSDSALMKNSLFKEFLSANGKGPDGNGPPGQNGGGGNGGGGGKGGGGSKGGCLASPGVSDADGNVYDTVRIGNQTWTVQNFRCSKFSDGTPITRVSVEGGNSNSQMFSATSAAYGYYLDDSASNNALYGKVYNSYAIDDSRFPPDGWHVATLSDWTTLRDYLLCNTCRPRDGDIPPTDSSSIKLRAAKRVWVCDTNLDSYCFNALPGGDIISTRSQFINTAIVFWPSPSTEATFIYLSCGPYLEFGGNSGFQFRPAMYVRLVKNTLPLNIASLGRKIK